MHPKNSTTTPSVQPPTLGHISFGDYASPLFGVLEGGNLISALDFAATLADGVSQLCGRLGAEINVGEIAYSSEVAALAFLSDAVSALTRSASRALSAATQMETAK